MATFIPSNHKSMADDTGSEDEGLLESHKPPNKHLKIHNPVFSSIIMTLVVFLLVILVAINSVALVWLYKTQQTKRSGNFYSKTANGLFPDEITAIYHDYDHRYLDHNVTAATQNWAALFPEGNGIVGLTSNEVVDLGIVKSLQGKSDPTKTIYLVAVFHQLHCLSQLRSQTIKLHLDPKFFIQDATYYHTMHCIDVLRQLITCASDGTLIFKRPEDKFPGEGGIRICKNFDALTQWTREHKYISQPEDSVIDPGAPSK